jgi:hypothetical protein
MLSSHHPSLSITVSVESPPHCRVAVPVLAVVPVVAAAVAVAIAATTTAHFC